MRTIIAFTLALAALLAPCAGRARVIPGPVDSGAESAPGAASGQGRLVNLDNEAVLAPGTLRGWLDARVFGGAESLTYGSAGAGYGFGEHWEALIRGSFASRKDFAISGGGGTIRHGGTAVEFALKHGDSSGRIAGLIGLSLPNTPAQADVMLTLGGMAGTPVGDRLTVHINPRAVFISSNSILGVGAGADLRLADAIHVVADYTVVLAGDNTRDTGTGARRRSDVWGAAVRIRPAPGFAVDLGYSKALGTTTGFSLTPGLGGSGAFYISLSARR